MKTINSLLVFATLFLLSCQKASFTNPQLASLWLINGVKGGKAVKVGNYAKIINNYTPYSLAFTPENDGLYVWPVDDSLHPYFTTSKLEVENGDSYSLFLGGAPTSVDGILVKNNIPYHKDSTCGVRFVNLAANSAAFNITLSTSPTVKEVGNLAYKQLTDFKIYPGKSSNTNYLFQIRETLKDSLLFTYNLSTPRFANVSLVILELPGRTPPAIAVMRINEDR